jgi:hypothetical protein
MHEYADCFTSTSPIPLVPTGQEMLFANQFPGNKRTLWTLNNANYSSVGGELLAVKHVPGAIYQDIWNNRKLEPRISDGVAYLNIRVRPRGPGCIVQTLL